MSSQLFDPGLQPERTRLAWRRTLLSLAVGALVGTRVLPTVAGVWTLMVCAGVLVVTACLTVAVGRRARRVDEALAHGAPLPGAAVLAVLAAIPSAGAIAVGVALVVR